MIRVISMILKGPHMDTLKTSVTISRLKQKLRDGSDSKALLLILFLFI